MLQKTDLAGGTALITGAGGGIGRATALRLAEAGMNIALVGRDEDKLRTTAELTGRAGDMLVIPTDITAPGAPDGILGKVASRYGGLDVLINNAGTALNCAYEATTEEQYDRIMNVNARAPFFLCQKALPLLRKSDRASIVNIGSVVSHCGYLHQAAYAASKHALLGFTKSLAKELAPEGIRVHLIAPGGVFTDMVRVARPDLGPEGMILPEEIAETIAFILEYRLNGVIDEIRMHRSTKEPFA